MTYIIIAVSLTLPEALAVCSFKPKPKGGEKLEVRLPDALGQDLLSRFHAQDQAVSEERFEDYFKGVAIVPDLAGSESLLTFTVADSSAALVLHYHLSDELSTEKELWFFPNTDTQFNHIDHDRSERYGRISDERSGDTFGRTW